MSGRILKHIILILMILNGIFFMTNIIVLGNTAAAIEMHEDLSPAASPSLANTKVVLCFLVGLFYIISSLGIYRKKFKLALFGVFAFILFDGFYVVELNLWGGYHPPVWIGFSIFGTLGIIFGIFSWFQWKTHKIQEKH